MEWSYFVCIHESRYSRALWRSRRPWNPQLSDSSWRNYTSNNTRWVFARVDNGVRVLGKVVTIEESDMPIYLYISTNIIYIFPHIIPIKELHIYILRDLSSLGSFPPPPSRWRAVCGTDPYPLRGLCRVDGPGWSDVGGGVEVHSRERGREASGQAVVGGSGRCVWPVVGGQFFSPFLILGVVSWKSWLGRWWIGIHRLFRCSLFLLVTHLETSVIMSEWALNLSYLENQKTVKYRDATTTRCKTSNFRKFCD